MKAYSNSAHPTGGPAFFRPELDIVSVRIDPTSSIVMKSAMASQATARGGGR
jgi:hypothetical protein